MQTIVAGGIEMELTPERKRRIVAGIAATQRQIDREMERYSAPHRNHNLIVQCQAHITKLQGVLDGTIRTLHIDGRA